MSRLRASVCAVGAGPAGLALAHRLHAARVPCIVLERLSSEALSLRAKTGMLEHRTVQALAPHGLAAPILERGTTNGVVEICVEGARHVFDYPALTGAGSSTSAGRRRWLPASSASPSMLPSSRTS